MLVLPILWRYAIQSYFRVFSLSIFAFIAVLFVSRFKEIARFAALSSDRMKTGIFIVYQFPSILPMAIPISALIASFLYCQRLSRSHELTAIRASGMGLGPVFCPLLFMGAALSLLNFGSLAEWAPLCRRQTKTLLYRETSTNPLLLLQRQKLGPIQDAYVRMQIEGQAQRAADFFLVLPSEGKQRLALLAADELEIVGNDLRGRGVCLISHFPARSQNQDLETFDPLVLENQDSFSASAPLLSAALKKSRPTLETQALGIKMLRLKAAKSARQAKAARFEILRRLSLSAAPFSFTLLGAVFGIEEARRGGRKNLAVVFCLSLLTLMSYFIGKEWRSSEALAAWICFFPHALIGIASAVRLKNIARGRR